MLSTDPENDIMGDGDLKKDREDATTGAANATSARAFAKTVEDDASAAADFGDCGCGERRCGDAPPRPPPPPPFGERGCGGVWDGALEGELEEEEEER